MFEQVAVLDLTKMISIGSKLSTTSQSFLNLPIQTLGELIIANSCLKQCLKNHTELPAPVLQEIYSFIILSPLNCKDSSSNESWATYTRPRFTSNLTLDQVYDKLQLVTSSHAYYSDHNILDHDHDQSNHSYDDTKDRDSIKNDCMKFFNDAAIREWYFQLETLMFPQNITTYDVPLRTRLNCLLFVFCGVFNYVNVFSIPILMFVLVIVLEKQLITNENKDNFNILVNVILGCFILDCFQAICFAVGKYYELQDQTKFSKFMHTHKDELNNGQRMIITENHAGYIFKIRTKTCLFYYQNWILLSILSKFKNIDEVSEDFDGRNLHLCGDREYGSNMKYQLLKWQNSKYIEYWWKYKKFYFLCFINLFCYVILQVFNVIHINRQNGTESMISDQKLITGLYWSFGALIIVWLIEFVAITTQVAPVDSYKSFWCEWKCSRGARRIKHKMPRIGYVFMFVICFWLLFIIYGLLFNIDNTSVYVISGFVFIGLTCCFFCWAGCFALWMRVWDEDGTESWASCCFRTDYDDRVASIHPY